MTLESVTGFHYILLLGYFSVPMKSMIPKSFFISSLETRETGLVPLACEILLLYKFV